ncbi:hypothetical protein Csa_006808 [Cucumis sativus]|uniref:Uncharacterized protein n=1 Tax=Cucumis sativus TaxID=3659 RepID=A0A0A0LIE6_CUCSA|nr:hypothetical protein Csa_006808 [Cucumis sativus]
MQKPRRELPFQVMSTLHQSKLHRHNTTTLKLSYCRCIDPTSTKLFCCRSDLTLALAYCQHVDLVGESRVGHNPMLTSSHSDVAITSYDAPIMMPTSTYPSAST